MERDTFHYSMLLKAPSSLALNMAREGAATASLGNLFHIYKPHTLTILKCYVNSYPHALMQTGAQWMIVSPY